jgi:alkaline phosphatase D
MQKHRLLISLALTFTVLLFSVISVHADESVSDWSKQHDRIWLGQNYWANPMENWVIKGGRSECTHAGAGRNVHLLAGRLAEKRGSFSTSVVVGRADDGKGRGSVGFELGIRSELGDYRSSLLRGRGLAAGMTTAGQLFIGRPNPNTKKIELPKEGFHLRVDVHPDGEKYEVTVSAYTNGAIPLATLTQSAAAAQLHGNIALINNFPGAKKGPGAAANSSARFWFSDWRVKGDKFVLNDEQPWGPILYAMHSLSRGVMKMTAQMPPVGKKDSNEVQLEIQVGKEWKNIGTASIDPLSRTATFRAEKWDDTKDTPYRLVYVTTDKTGKIHRDEFSGTVRKDPVDKNEISVAGFTGNQDTAFPNELLAKNVEIQNPDVLFFSGDQIYEGVGGYGIIRLPVEPAVVNYLRKIYLWGWAFRDVMRDRVTLVMPDDHDVYQGNIWGQGGRFVNGIKEHSQGGYAMHPEFVNAVERTITSHHPDAYDPTPVEQGISVYYGDMVYGRISFAVVEDRKFKSGPEGKVNDWKGRPDHLRDKNYDVKKLDKPGLVLLGDRQLTFLEKWTNDWRGADMKVVCSQTIFCNLANYHGGNQMYLVADLDSNGWPQTPRNRALEVIRKGFAFHYAGDQHLPSIVHYGVDDWNDSGFAFCVPSIAAGYPRSWRPDAEGQPVQNRPKAGLPNTGEYKDGLKNIVTVHAIGNPAKMNRKPVLELLHDKSSGHGIVRFNKKKQTLTMECWKLLFDAKKPKADDQFPGWPKTVSMQENYGRKAVGYLPTIQVNGMKNPVVEVKDEKTGEIVYTLRINGMSFSPKIFEDSTYTVTVGNQETGTLEKRSGLRPVKKGETAVLEIQF